MQIYLYKKTNFLHEVIEVKKSMLILILLIGISIVGCSSQQFQKQNNQKQLNQHDQDYLSEFPKEELSEDEIEALDLTINDEFKAEATYQKVLYTFGEIRPFSNIINAEKKHSDALSEIYYKYSLDIPANDWYNKVPDFDSVQEACQAGVEAEIENVALYDDLFAKVDNQDILAVFTSLRDASQNSHLPAFKRCAER